MHGPGWVETPDEVLRRRLEPLLASDGWVVDGSYERKLGDLVLAAADTVIWLDLPIRVWLPRLVRRSWQRLRGHERLWNDNRETLRGLVWGGESLFAWAFRMHFRHRRAWPARLALYPVVRLRSEDEVARFVASV